MEFALVLRELGKKRRLIALGVVISAILAILATYQVGLFPPRLHARALQHSTATTQVYVDSPVSSLGDAGQNMQPLVDISTVLARLMASPTLLNQVGHYAGIPGGEIYATGPIEANLTRFVQEPSEGKRAAEVAGETNPYRLEFDADGVIPVIDIYSQAPTNAAADALATGAAKAVNGYVQSLEANGKIPHHLQVTIRQLGVPTAAVSDTGITKKLGALIFVGVLIFWCAGILLLSRFLRSWRESAQVAALRNELALSGVQATGHGDLMPLDLDSQRSSERRDPARSSDRRDPSRSSERSRAEAAYREERRHGVDLGAEAH